MKKKTPFNMKKRLLKIYVFGFPRKNLTTKAETPSSSFFAPDYIHSTTVLCVLYHYQVVPLSQIVMQYALLAI